MSMGNGYFSNRRGKRTMASHCSPTLPDRRPKTRYISLVIQELVQYASESKVRLYLCLIQLKRN